MMLETTLLSAKPRSEETGTQQYSSHCKMLMGPDPGREAFF
jgi:hypothetical protein